MSPPAYPTHVLHARRRQPPPLIFQRGITPVRASRKQTATVLNRNLPRSNSVIRRRPAAPGRDRQKAACGDRGQSKCARRQFQAGAYSLPAAPSGEGQRQQLRYITALSLTGSAKAAPVKSGAIFAPSEHVPRAARVAGAFNYIHERNGDGQACSKSAAGMVSRTKIAQAEACTVEGRWGR